MGWRVEPELIALHYIYIYSQLWVIRQLQLCGHSQHTVWLRDVSWWSDRIVWCDLIKMTLFLLLLLVVLSSLFFLVRMQCWNTMWAKCFNEPSANRHTSYSGATMRMCAPRLMQRPIAWNSIEWKESANEQRIKMHTQTARHVFCTLWFGSVAVCVCVCV